MASNEGTPRTESSPEPAPASILVVDDNDVNCTLLRRRLERESHHVTVAHDGREALQQIDSARFDLVLLDVVMPELSGIEVLEIVRKRYGVSDLPIIMATSNDESADIVDAFTRGANDYVTKPFDFSVVMARVRTQLALRRAMEENRRLVQQVELRNQFIRQLFGRYVDNEIVSQLLESQEALSMEGQKRRITVLMADLRGFSMMAESLAAGERRHRDQQLSDRDDRRDHGRGRHDRRVHRRRHPGPLRRAGRPRPTMPAPPWPARCGCTWPSSEVNRRNAAEGLPAVEMGVGINTGEVVVGNIGSERRTKYSVVGHHVNLASRIESYTLGGQLLVSGDTLAAAGADVVTAGTLRVHPKGFPEPVLLHSVRGMSGEGLLLPEFAETAVGLPKPLPASFTVVEGKDGSGALIDVAVLALSAREALVRGAAPEVLANVKMQIRLDDAAAASTLYGKVTEKSESDGEFRVRFTSVAPDVAQQIHRMLQG